MKNFGRFCDTSALKIVYQYSVMYKYIVTHKYIAKNYENIEYRKTWKYKIISTEECRNDDA